jgi:gliding motility-associated-like protein
MNWPGMIFLLLLSLTITVSAKAAVDDTTVIAPSPVQPGDTGEYNFPFVETIICPGCCSEKLHLFLPQFTVAPQTYRMRVFDRWGNIVFETTSYTQGWDGKKDGVILQAGTYVWQITFTLPEEEEQKRAGQVSLIRN